MDTNTEYVGKDGQPLPQQRKVMVDLAQVSIGRQTFTNPCFWILVGIGISGAAYWFFNQKKKD